MATEHIPKLSTRMRHHLRFTDLVAADGNVARIVSLPMCIEIETNNRLDMLSTIITTMAAQARRKALDAQPNYYDPTCGDL